MKNGRRHEEEALILYLPLDIEKKSKTGYWLHHQNVGLGCSPNGIIRNNGDKIIAVIAINCPHVLENIPPFHIENMKPNQKNFHHITTLVSNEI